MLHEFLTAHRDELIDRCRRKVSTRASPPVTPLELEHGVPLFLDQLVAALRGEEADPAAASMENSRTAALHGKELLDDGYTVEQVVHDYGDICQSITELATQENAAVAVDEFRTFNRLLDDAISDAVASYGRHRQEAIAAKGDEKQRDWRGDLGDEQRRLLDTAVQAFAALKVGNIGLNGATGTLLEASLTRLRELIDRSLPQARPKKGMTAPSRP